MGWTQAQVARAADLPRGLQSYVSLAERGRRIPEATLRRIKGALDAEEHRRETEVRREADAQAREAAIAAMPPSEAWDAFRATMCARILDLYDQGLTEHGDVLLEFLPDDEARALLDDYFGDPMEESAPSDGTQGASDGGDGVG